MNKNITILGLSLLLAVGVQAQFTFEKTGPDLKQDKVETDISFDYDLTNGTSTTLELRWRLMENDFPVEEWDDYVCDVVCYDSSMRARDLDLNGDTVFGIIHYIDMDKVEGFGTSTLCFWERADSAGTIQCITARSATCWDFVTDTIEMEVDGSNYYIVEGMVYELDAGNMTLVGASGTISLQSCDLLTIGENIFEFEYSAFDAYDYDQYTKDGEEIIIVEGGYYTYDGNKYVYQGDAEEDKIDGVDVIIIDGDTFEIFQESLVPLGVDGLGISTIRIYPNPANDVIVISGSENSRVFAQVIDLSGRVVMSELTNGALNVSDLPTGFYTIRLEEDNSVITRQVSIVH